MKYFYDRKSDSLYLTLAERPYGDSIEAAPGVVLDFDKDGRLIGLDLERASKSVEVSDLAMHEQPVGKDAEAAYADGASLKREREALGFTQAELGRKLSVSSNTIARWERGELKIEHPAMLQLAMASLRKNRPQVNRVPIPTRMTSGFRSGAERRTTRTTKSRNSSGANRVKKK